MIKKHFAPVRQIDIENLANFVYTVGCMRLILILCFVLSQLINVGYEVLWQTNHF